MYATNFKYLEKYVSESDKEIKTPAPPGQILHKPNDKNLLLNDDDLTKYFSGTGKALYFVKVSCPNIYYFI